MENKTAEELDAAKTLSEIRENIAAKYGFSNWPDYRAFWRMSKASPIKIESVYNELATTYASLQCAEMKKEIERLKGEGLSGITLIKMERERQILKEGWSDEHDAGHFKSEMAIAAAIYATPPDKRKMKSIPTALAERGFIQIPKDWPWHYDWWRPNDHDRIRELTKAGALIAAEIDRLLKCKKDEQESNKTSC